MRMQQASDAQTAHRALPCAQAQLPAHLRDLLAVLIAPRLHASLNEARWDRTIRTARSARLLGTLAARVLPYAHGESVPTAARRMLNAALIESAFRRQKVRFLLHAITDLCTSITPRVVVLKGAAYELQQADIAAGRMPADVDLLVPLAALSAVEDRLLGAGWEFAKTSAYDQHYYRAWSHELPPMQCAGHALELDLHHAILPPLGRLRPDVDVLIDAAVPIPGQPFFALALDDQLLHVAAHLFEDSDCSNRLRDLLDFDALLRQYMRTADAERDRAELAARIVARAALLRLTRPLSYAAAFAYRWCETPGSVEVLDVLRCQVSARSAATVALIASTLGPPDPNARSGLARRASERLLSGRALWLRMPPHLVLFHIVSKAKHAIVSTRQESMESAE